MEQQGFRPELIKMPSQATLAFLAKYAKGMVLNAPIPIKEATRTITIEINPRRVAKWKSMTHRVFMWEERDHNKKVVDGVRKKFDDYTYSYYLMDPNEKAHIRPSTGPFDFKNKLIEDNLQKFMTVTIKDDVGHV